MTKKTAPRVAVVIPAYRAEQHIRNVIAGIPVFISSIIIVDDCSPDSTAQLIKSCGDTRIVFLSHDKNLGVGGAVLTGYKKALELKAEIVVKMDSDDQMDPTYVPQLLAPIILGKADYVKGNRFIHSNELRSMPLLRRIGNACLSFLAKGASGYWNIFDPTNGYTAIHTSVISLLDTSRIDFRYFFESSLLIELGVIRAVVQDVNIPARYQQERSSLSEWKAFLEFPPKLMRGFLRRFIIQYFIRDFGALSVLFILGIILSTFGLLFGIYHWYLSYATSIIASTGTVMLAVLPLLAGLQLLLQALIVDIGNVPKEPIHRSINSLEAITNLIEFE